MTAIQAAFAFRAIFMGAVLPEEKVGKCFNSLKINGMQQELGWYCDDGL